MKSLRSRLACCFASAFATFVLFACWAWTASADTGSCLQAAFALDEKPRVDTASHSRGDLPCPS